MKLNPALLTSGATSKVFSDDVFSSFTYTGNGSTQTITNGIDLAGKGGLVWLKDRTSANPSWLYDTVRGTSSGLKSSSMNGAYAVSTAVTASNSNGFTIGSDVNSNTNNNLYASWTIREAAGFFDIVTYTGNGANRTIAHSLGQVPGMIVVKRTDTAGAWMVYHNSISNTENLVLNTTAAKATDTTVWNSTTATASAFSIGTHADVNTNAGTYVAYLFAHDTSADGLIQCGSLNVASGSGNTTVNLGWEPQFLITKISNQAGYNWNIYDSMRGWVATTGGNYNARLNPNTSGAETSDQHFQPNATGFQAQNSAIYTGSSTDIIYLAIRRPNKPPTTGTQVYNAIARTGTGADAGVTGVGFAPDVCWAVCRDLSQETGRWDRLRGPLQGLRFNSDAELAGSAGLSSFNQSGVSYIGTGGALYSNTTGLSYINHFFKRAPGVLSQICYSGTGANKTEAHDLGVAPELWLVKGRSGATQWVWGSSLLANTEKIVMPTPAGKVTDATVWNSTYPTSSALSLGTAAAVNTSAATYTAYLWATLAGVSKVFSYTGNGSSQNINCGFATGARFILIVRTSASGSVYIWDAVRGVVAGNDPYLALDTTAAEVTTDDSVDPLASGFTVNQLAASNVNVNGATYLGLAYA